MPDDHVVAKAREIKGVLDALDQDIRNDVMAWGGQAKAAYLPAKAQWDESLTQMINHLQEAATGVGDLVLRPGLAVEPREVKAVVVAARLLLVRSVLAVLLHHERRERMAVGVDVDVDRPRHVLAVALEDARQLRDLDRLAREDVGVEHVARAVVERVALDAYQA